MKIIPDEIPENYVALPAEHQGVSFDGPADAAHINLVSGLVRLAGKNVFVNFKDGTSEVGMLHSVQVDNFMVGNHRWTKFFVDVVSFREV
jgi:hypothetical protein